MYSNSSSAVPYTFQGIKEYGLTIRSVFAVYLSCIEAVSKRAT